MGNLGGGEFLVILLVALLVLGPDKLPGAARQVGKVMGDLRRLTTGFQSEVRRAMEFDDKPVTAAVVPDGRPLVPTLETTPSAETPAAEAPSGHDTPVESPEPQASAPAPAAPEPREPETPAAETRASEPVASLAVSPVPPSTTAEGAEGRRPVITLETRPRRPAPPADATEPAGSTTDTEPQS